MATTLPRPRWGVAALRAPFDSGDDGSDGEYGGGGDDNHSQDDGDGDSVALPWPDAHAGPGRTYSPYDDLLDPIDVLPWRDGSQSFVDFLPSLLYE